MDELSNKSSNEKKEILDLEGLLELFKDKLDSSTVLMIVEEFHGHIPSAFDVLEQLAESKAEKEQSS